MQELSRRTFLKQTAVAGAAVAALSSQASAAEGAGKQRKPWYRRTLRWGQTNITEIDPTRYDIPWWREHWRRTRTQGVIINAGGIFAFYPSKYPLQHRPEALGERDLYGELARAAHADGLAVLARMDSNRVHEPFFRAHPDWIALDAAGKPYRAGDLYVTCINSPYYDEYIPNVLREIIERTHPEGITDNSWSGLGRGSICHCENCRRKFHDKTGHEIPREKNWNAASYRAWIQWNYARRIEVWELNNRTTREAGGPDCLWICMNSGSISGQCQSFRDYKEICARAEIIMLDHQARNNTEGFQHNGIAGKTIHGLLGWDKLIPESMAMYQAGKPTFRVASKPAAEARLWMLDGFAGGLQPWWHHVAAYHEDRRMYRTAEPVLRWHEENEQYLLNRAPVATIGVLWSQKNTDFYGRDNAEELVELPFRGVTNALIRARIPWLPIHADHLERTSGLAAVVLPNLAALSDAQAQSVRRFVSSGGGLLATGESSGCDEWGDARADFALADLFGAHTTPERRTADDSVRVKRATETAHSYLRLAPELRAGVYGPRTGTEPKAVGPRHPVLRGFDETDILPFGGVLEPLRVVPGTHVLATYVPPFPVYPPETSWMREPATTIPGLVLNENGRGRVAFLPVDIDRRYGRDGLPDHGDLLANLVRWVSRDVIPLEMKGAGFIDCHLYRQGDRLLLHLVNLTNAGTWRAPVDELIPVGPLQVRLKLPSGVRGGKARLLVADRTVRVNVRDGWAHLEVGKVLDHELVVVG